MDIAEKRRTSLLKDFLKHWKNIWKPSALALTEGLPLKHWSCGSQLQVATLSDTHFVVMPMDTVTLQSSIQVRFLNLHACADQKICKSLPGNNLVLWASGRLPSTLKVSPWDFCKGPPALPEVCTKLLLHQYIFLHIWLWGQRSGVLPYFCNYLIQHQKTFPLFHFIHVHNHRQSFLGCPHQFARHVIWF